MAMKKGLGRGLDLLIPKAESNHDKQNMDKNIDSQKSKENVEILLNIDEVEPNRNQPRKQFDEDAIEELAESIKQYGVIQPVIVQKKNDFYEIIAGERRWRACKKAGIRKIPAIIREYSETEILKISLIENLQRENLNPIEEAKAYQRLQDEYNLKQDEIAASVSKSRTAITNTMRLLKLEDRVQKMVLEGVISSGHGRTLLPITDNEVQYQTAMKILDENLSVRESERLVKHILEKKEETENTNENQKGETENSKETQQMLQFFEGKMKNIFGSKVSIKNKKNNKGKIEIEYYSKEELERIIDIMQSMGEET